MLYKKIHRQHVRQFQKGRKYNQIYEVLGKPYTYRNTVRVWVENIGNGCSYKHPKLLINVYGQLLGINIKWLD